VRPPRQGDDPLDALARTIGPFTSGRLLSATEVAVRLGVSRDWVYAYAGELGVCGSAAGSVRGCGSILSSSGVPLRPGCPTQYVRHALARADRSRAEWTSSCSRSARPARYRLAVGAVAEDI